MGNRSTTVIHSDDYGMGQFLMDGSLLYSPAVRSAPVRPHAHWRDSYGCKASAGEEWCEAEGVCIGPGRERGCGESVVMEEESESDDAARRAERPIVLARPFRNIL